MTQKDIPNRVGPIPVHSPEGDVVNDVPISNDRDVIISALADLLMADLLGHPIVAQNGAQDTALPLQSQGQSAQGSAQETRAREEEFSTTLVHG